MNDEQDRIDYSQYDEDLIPTRVILVGRDGNELEVDGFIGVITGEIYYSRDSLVMVEGLLST